MLNVMKEIILFFTFGAFLSFCFFDAPLREQKTCNLMRQNFVHVPVQSHFRVEYDLAAVHLKRCSISKIEQQIKSVTTHCSLLANFSVKRNNL